MADTKQIIEAIVAKDSALVHELFTEAMMEAVAERLDEKRAEISQKLFAEAKKSMKEEDDEEDMEDDEDEEDDKEEKDEKDDMNEEAPCETCGKSPCECEVEEGCKK